MQIQAAFTDARNLATRRKRYVLLSERLQQLPASEHMALGGES